MPRYAAFVVALIAAAAQASGLCDVLVWDDVLMLRRTDLYTNPARWAESLTTPLGRETFYWRPAATTSFLLESMAHGGAGWGYRLTSTLLHAGASALAYVLLARLLKSPKAAFAAALVFAVHPVNVEAALWPSGRFDLLLGLLTLGALAAMPRGVASPSKWVLSAVCAALAFASKESALLLPLVGVLWCEATGETVRSRWVPAAWLGAGVAAAAFLRFEAIGFLFRTREASVSEAGGALQHVLLVGRAFATSLLTLVWPWGTVGPAHYAVRPIPPGDGLGWAGIGLGLVFVAVTIAALRRRRTVGWLLALFLVTLAPTSQIVPLDVAGGLHTSDRYLYLPMVFAIAAAAVLVCDWIAARPSRGRPVAWVAGLLVAALIAGRVAAVHVWNDPVRFWRRAVEMAPGSQDMLSNLARAEMEAGDLDSAESHARSAGRAHAGFLAEILFKMERFRDAVDVLTAAIEASPTDAWLRVQRGEVRMVLGMMPAAGEDFEEAIRLEEGRTGPQFAPLLGRALADSAEVLARTTDPVLARERVTRAESLADPRDADTWVRITRAWITLREAAAASRALDRAERSGASKTDTEVLRAHIRQISQ